MDAPTVPDPSPLAGLPAEAYAAALAGLPFLTPARLAVMLDVAPWPEVWAMLSGVLPPTPRLARLWSASPDLRTRWRDACRERSPSRCWEACVSSGTSVLVHGRRGYPELLMFDPRPAPVLFVRGDTALLGGRRVGIVGTRSATETGRVLATRLGRDLARSGVNVVSGLARGIDGCAHRGVVDAVDTIVGGSPGRPIAVVASGPDVPFPRMHTALWERVAAEGLLISEHPPGSPALAHWFPLRNRIIAALSEVLVVVESKAVGGSLITVREAALRGVDVLAVPGSVLNRSADGTNRIISEGGHPVLDADDVLVALGLDTRRAGAAPFDSRQRPSSQDRSVLDAFLGDALTLDELARRIERPVVDLALAVGRLESTGWLRPNGGWFEPIDARERST